MSTLEILFRSVLLAISVVGLTIILRNAPVIRTWVFQMKKPWACNVCLPIWLCGGVLAFLLGYTQNLSFLFIFLPAYAMSYIILEKLARPPQVPFVPLEFSENEEKE